MPPVEDLKSAAARAAHALSSHEKVDDDAEDGVEDALGVDLEPEGPRELVETHFTVEANYAGWRLDKYLMQKIRRASRTRIQQIIATDLVAARKLKASTTVSPGMTFTLRRMMRAEPTVPGFEHLREVFLDDSLLVLDKPPGLPIHATARYHHNTVIGHLARKYGPSFEATPAHRLDRETSGLLVCARTLEASQRLFTQFSKSSVRKSYLAIVEGTPPESFDVDAPIAEGTELIRIAVRIDRALGRPAHTHFEVEQRFEREGRAFAVLLAHPLTGRQHQIRIHAREAGYPLVGDKMYGPDPAFFDRFTKRTLDAEAWARLRLERHALHASTLELEHPATRERVRFEAPLAPDLQAFVNGQ